MSIAEQIAEFIVLWEKLQVHLSDEPDAISWRWTSSGTYTSKSAYTVQFHGSFCSFNTKAIWKASAEALCVAARSKQDSDSGPPSDAQLAV
jgi:hypothetical protein